MDSHITVEPLPLEGLCNLCLRVGYAKSMFSEYNFNGTIEIYADMLAKSFSIDISDNRLGETKRLICDDCCDKLRNVIKFREQVESALQTLEDTVRKVKEENDCKDEQLTECDNMEDACVKEENDKSSDDDLIDGDEDLKIDVPECRVRLHRLRTTRSNTTSVVEKSIASTISETKVSRVELIRLDVMLVSGLQNEVSPNNDKNGSAQIEGSSESPSSLGAKEDICIETPLRENAIQTPKDHQADSCKYMEIDNDPYADLSVSESDPFSASDDSDYDPDSYGDSDTEDEYYGDSNIKKTARRHKKSINAQEEKMGASSQERNKETPEERSDTSSCQNRKGKRKVNYRNMCFYCERVVTHFSRHLLKHHANEKEVINYQSVDDEDPKVRRLKRQQIIDSLRKEFNLIDDSRVSFDGDDELGIASNKISTQRVGSPSVFATCKNCLRSFKRSTFYRHVKKCGANVDSNAQIALESHEDHVRSDNGIELFSNTASASSEPRQDILLQMRRNFLTMAKFR